MNVKKNGKRKFRNSTLKQTSCELHITNNQDVLKSLPANITFKNALDIISKDIYERNVKFL